MNAVYDLADGRKLMMYVENNRILLLFTPMRPGHMPFVRHNDCLGYLSSLAWRGRIYYVYENFTRQIIFGCLDDPNTQVILSPLAQNQWFERPVLHEAGGNLYLFYIRCFDDEKRSFYMRSPWDGDLEKCLWHGEEGPLYVNWYHHNHKDYMELERGHESQSFSGNFDENFADSDRGNEIVRTFVWNIEEKSYEIIDENFGGVGADQNGKELLNAKELWQREKESLEHALAKAREERETLKNCVRKKTPCWKAPGHSTTSLHRPPGSFRKLAGSGGINIWRRKKLKISYLFLPVRCYIR